VRKLILLVGAALLATATFVASPVTPADAHTNTAANVCLYGEIAFFGPEPNEVGIYGTTTFHYYGLHYYKCCYVSLRYGFKVEALYLEGWDVWSWPTGDPWCPGS